MIGVEDSGAGADKLELFRTSLGVPYPLYHDPTRAMKTIYNVTQTSTTYIISPDFVVRDKTEGGTGSGWLQYSFERYGLVAP